MFKQPICFEVWGGSSGKYRLLDNEGNPVDKTPEDTCKRVAKYLADVEPKDKEEWYNKFLSIMGTKFAGGGRIMANAGALDYKKEVSLINCVVSSQIADSMESIMDVAKEAALVLKSGCGIGYDFSPLRPKGAHVYGSGAGTSGVISFMKVFDTICSTILSGGGRRGAQLAALDIQHPDVIEFIEAKRQDGVLRYFNISTLITDKFMKAVEKKSSWDLWFWEKIRNVEELKLIDKKKVKLIVKNDIPFNHTECKYFNFASDHAEVKYNNCTMEDIYVKKIYQTIDANLLFDKVIKSTYNFNDPGFLMIDKVNTENNLWFCETIRTTNPCVTGDTRLHTNHGIVKVKDLYDSQVEINCTVDNRTFKNADQNINGTSIRSALPIFKTSNSAKIFKIETKAGYEIKATEWHSFFTPRGKIELKDLKIGDALYIQSGEGQWGDQGSYDLGLIYGLLVGDGHFSHLKNNKIDTTISLWGKDKELSNDIEKRFNNLIKNEKTLSNHKSRYCKFIQHNTKDEMRISSKILSRVLVNLGVDTKNKYKLPEFLWQGSKDCVKGFLQGLFQSDGCAIVSSGSCEITLCSVEKELLFQTQALLSNFGILSRICVKREECEMIMPGGRLCKAKKAYNLIISSNSRDIFMKKIGFLLTYKVDKYNEFNLNRIRNRVQKFETEITSINYIGEEAVYDTTQKDGNGIIFNGIATSNCGEQPLSPNSSCLLGSMILPSYISNSFTNKALFDFEEFKKDIRLANRLMDNVVEVNKLPLQIIDNALRYQRRHGLGITGLGSLLNMMQISYGSKESIEFSEKLMLIMAQESLLENIELAKEKGCAPVFNTLEARQKYMESGYNKRLLNTFSNKEEIIYLIEKYGVRYSHATSIAPTGTMSLTWGNNCSNGLEPVFSNFYLRNIRVSNKKTKVQEEVFDYAFMEWKKAFGDKELPSYWRTTDNLKIEDHTSVQEVIQKWCDSSVSKTINVPFDYPYEEFKNVYINAWKAGLKGITTFRFNPEITAGVLVQKSDLENTNYTFSLEDKTEIRAKGSDIISYDGEEHIASNLFDALKEGIYGNM